jgi:glycosyltransferase involved in cell wall biosynthesis
MKKTAIITVSFNVSKLIEHQIKSFKKFCKDNYELIVVDNSTKQDEIVKIKKLCEDNNIKLIRTNINVFNTFNNSSNNHGLSLNYVYNLLKKEFDYLFFVDHDLFAIKDFSVEEILGDKLMAGHEQIINNIKYFWPGLLMLGKIKEDLDFTPVHPLDTGGKLSKYILENPNKVLTIKHKHVPIDLKFNDYYMHEFYDDLHNGTFMHFIKASNWCNVNENTFNARQNYLYSLLNDYID